MRNGSWIIGKPMSKAEHFTLSFLLSNLVISWSLVISFNFFLAELGFSFYSLSQISECSKLFRNLGGKYGSLYQSSFDADPVSLQNVEMYPLHCYYGKYEKSVIKYKG